MWLSRRFVLWRPFRRRLCAAVTLFAYLITIFGYPLPTLLRAGGGGSSCQDRGCGCPPEAQRRHQCCCSKPDRRSADKPASPKQTRPTNAPRGHSCCETPPAPDAEPGCESPCCKKQTPQTTPPTSPNPKDSDSDDPEQTDDDPAEEPDQDHGTRWAVGVSAMKCQGLSTLWVTSGAAMPCSIVIAWSPDLRPTSWLGVSDLSSHVLSQHPPVPPPRSFLS
jgi:hypothetical protein